MARAARETETRVLEILSSLRSLNDARELFAELNYDSAHDRLSRQGWPRAASEALCEDPQVIASHDGFQIIYGRLDADGLLLGKERPVVNRLLQQHPYQLCVFSDRDQSMWHFVNVKFAEDAGRRRLFRRITVGPGERLRTASERLSLVNLEEISRDLPSIQPLDIQTAHDNAFDVEAVTSIFFKTFANLYHAVREEIGEIPGLEHDAGQHAQLLLNRLLFLYFVQKKGWLGNDLCYLYDRFQAHHREAPDSFSYYSSVLYPLFLALSDPNPSPREMGAIPFLNGGLFEFQLGKHQTNRLSQTRLRIRNSTFRAIFKDLLERFNFTVAEDTPLDSEVAIDPEMLGKIFESLILELEKEPGKDLRRLTGSYYTPRPIVHFMCHELLKNYLATKSGLARRAIGGLVSLPPASHFSDEDHGTLRQVLTKNEARSLRGAILECRVCDPAVGSGAFLVGMLHEMVSAVEKLDLLLEGRDIIARRNHSYELKRHIIENCLYGVDIQEQAVRLCELRLWLSLVVDYELDPSLPFERAIREVPSLPNLSYRIRQGDSLLERMFGHVVQLDEMTHDAATRSLIKEIQKEKAAYFVLDDVLEKRRQELRILAKQADLAERLAEAKRQAMKAYQKDLFGDEHLGKEDKRAREEFERSLEEYEDIKGRVTLAREKLDRLARQESPLARGDLEALRRQHFQTGGNPSFLWRIDFAEVFAEKGGFDLVLGNPPYLRLQGIKAGMPEIVPPLRRFFLSARKGNFDLYVCFIERGYKLLCADGNFAFINPHKFFQAAFGEPLRKLLADSQAVRMIVSFGANQMFSESTNYTCLLFLSHIPQGDLRYAAIDRIEDNEHLADMLREASAEHEVSREGLSAGRIGGGRLSAAEWHLGADARSSLLSKLREFPLTLGDVTRKIFVGLQTSADKIYFVEDRGTRRDQVLRVWSRSLAEEIEIERGIVKPLLKGEDVHRYCPLNPRIWCIFPYDLSGDAPRLLTQKEIKTQYPLAWDYLCRNRAALEARERGRMRGDQFYAYIYPKNLMEFDRPKILTPEIALGCQMTYDSQGLSHTTKIYGFAFKDGRDEHPLYWLAILNSLLLWSFLVQTGYVLRGGYYTFKTNYLKPFPVPGLDLRTARGRSLHDDLVALVQEILAAKRAGKPTEHIDRQIDQLVYEVYGLTREEIEIVERSKPDRRRA